MNCIMQDERFYDPTGESFALGDGQVQVWRASLRQPQWQIDRFAQTLSPDEKERAGRFRRDRDRRRFIVARGLLRHLLARYLKTTAPLLTFAYGRHGKPALQDTELKVQFNLSHSHELALLAVAYDRKIGIDLEAIRADIDVEAIARRFFTPQEYALICDAPRDRRLAAFYSCWTMKEAYSKASGDSLAAALEPLEPDFQTGQARSSGAARSQSEATSVWWSYQIPALTGYAAALVTEGRCREVRLWNWMEG